MEFFKRAKAVRLRSQHKKYLIAHEDEETVKQSRSGSSKNARWTVEFIEGKPNFIRLKSCHSWKYLAASEDPFLLGMTGKKVIQASPRLRLDPTVEWEPIKDGSHLKLRTPRKSTFLRANGGIPPWNNSVTHDLPSRTATQDWILWTVDVLEVDYLQSSSTVEVEASSVSSSASSVPDQCRPLSRKLSSDSSASVEEESKDYYEVASHAAPGSARSVHSSGSGEIHAPSPRASSTSSEKPSAQIPPLCRHISHESQHSSSFNKLKSMLDGLQDLLEEEADTKREYSDSHSDSDSDSDSFSQTSSHPHPLEVKMAKQTLEELKDMDYNTVLSLGREKKLEKAVNILIADEKLSARAGQVLPSNIREQLKALRTDHDSASQDLVEYTTFSAKRLETKTDLKREAAKAHELQTMEVGFTNMLASAKAKREELLKQLEEVENSISAAERAQADNAVEIEELISRIGQRSENLREMEKMEKSWQVRKFDAESTLERVEEEWVKVKSLFQDHVF